MNYNITSISIEYILTYLKKKSCLQLQFILVSLIVHWILHRVTLIDIIFWLKYE